MANDGFALHTRSDPSPWVDPRIIWRSAFAPPCAHDEERARARYVEATRDPEHADPASALTDQIHIDHRFIPLRREAMFWLRMFHVAHADATNASKDHLRVRFDSASLADFLRQWRARVGDASRVSWRAASGLGRVLAGIRGPADAIELISEALPSSPHGWLLSDIAMACDERDLAKISALDSWRSEWAAVAAKGGRDDLWDAYIRFSSAHDLEGHRGLLAQPHFPSELATTSALHLPTATCRQVLLEGDPELTPRDLQDLFARHGDHAIELLAELLDATTRDLKEVAGMLVAVQAPEMTRFWLKRRDTQELGVYASVWLQHVGAPAIAGALELVETELGPRALETLRYQIDAGRRELLDASIARMSDPTERAHVHALLDDHAPSGDVVLFEEEYAPWMERVTAFTPGARYTRYMPEELPRVHTIGRLRRLPERVVYHLTAAILQAGSMQKTTDIVDWAAIIATVDSEELAAYFSALRNHYNRQGNAEFGERFLIAQMLTVTEEGFIKNAKQYLARASRADSTMWWALTLIDKPASRFLAAAHVMEQWSGREKRTLRERFEEAFSMDPLDALDQFNSSFGLDSSGAMTWGVGASEVALSLDSSGKISYSRTDQDGAKKTYKRFPSFKQGDDEIEHRDAKDAASTLAQNINAYIDIKTRLLRLSMYTARTWTYERWRQDFHTHPIISRLTNQLVWRVTRGDESFDVLPGDDWSYADVNYDMLELEAEDIITLVHPASMSASERAAWAQVIAEDELIQPIAQMSREVWDYDEEQLDFARELASDITRTMSGQTRAAIKRAGWKIASSGMPKVIWRYRSTELRAALVLDTRYRPKVDAPGLHFLDRAARSAIAPADVSSIIFSETMRLLHELRAALDA